MPLLGNRLLGKSRSDPYLALINSLAPMIWYQGKESLGAGVAVNSGSLGAAQNSTLTAVVAGQTGQLGASEALLFDGVDSLMSTPNSPVLSALLAYEIIMLINPLSSGESGIGTLFSWGNTLDEPTIRWSGLGNVIVDVYNNAATQFRTASTTGFNPSEWAFLSVTYEDTVNRKIRIRKGTVEGVFTELAYIDQPALTGVLRIPTSELNIGNTTSQGRTYHGYIDEFLYFDGILSDVDRDEISTLAGA